MNDKPKTHAECYGQLFPDFEQLRYNEPTDGKAFRVFLQQIGAGRQRREMEVKEERWEECAVCEDFQPCYELSMAKLALHRALVQC